MPYSLMELCRRLLKLTLITGLLLAGCMKDPVFNPDPEKEVFNFIVTDHAKGIYKRQPWGTV